MAGRRRSPFHVILLAGGSGTRFWPLSRAHRPKQLLELTGRQPLLVQTWRRMRKLAPPSRMWVVAPAALVRPIRALLPELRAENMIVEPTPRDTGPAVALACATVARKHPGAAVGMFPTDHVVGREPPFFRAVQSAVKSAEAGRLVCLGVKPDRPATGFGYLKCVRVPRGVRAVDVERFVEKPDARRARRFLRDGRYLWNAGMFVWRVDRFDEELRRTTPAIARAVEGHLRGRKGAWSRATRLSVDYAVMEKACGVAVVPLDAAWDDVGSWDAAGRLRAAGGARDARHILVDSPDSVVFGDQRLVALVDVPGVAVVDTPDALLIVSRDKSEGVREVVQRLRRRGAKDLL